MIIYLDQNKWIELARIANGVDTSVRDEKILAEFREASENGCIFPLAATHYIEFSRIKDLGRRKRLGSFMWELSQGKTFAPYGEIVEREIEIALQGIGINIVARDADLIGVGVEFAFGRQLKSELLDYFKVLVNKSILTGNEMLSTDPIKTINFNTQRKNFLNHLNELNEKKHQLEKAKWDDWLHAISTVDIIEPLYRVFCLHNLDKSIFENMEIENHRNFLMSMPTRKLDIHLHREVIKNDQYKPKPSDLEDWGGIGVASCYCDVVVCEKHFADMLQRNSYKSAARIETKLDNVF
ncbi:MAG: hypothetical protein KBT79_08890 [Thalassolituus oleivorans]|nr:hypothetical protein [Thalassolituus oleivorans]